MATRFLQPYYVVNALVLASYVPVRMLVIKPMATADVPLQDADDDGLFKLDAYLGLPREFEIIITLVLYLAMQYRRAKSIEGFVSTAFMYTKVAVVLMAYFGSRTAFYWYLIVFAVLALLLQGPRFAWSDNVEEMDTDQVEALQGPAAGAKRSTLVFCGVEGHQSCAEFVPSFSWLADKHASDKLVFAKVDLGDNEDAAKRLSIDTAMESIQLPTLILYQDKKEQRRLPPLDADGNAVPAVFDKLSVEAYFSLADRSAGKKVRDADATSKKDS